MKYARVIVPVLIILMVAQVTPCLADTDYICLKKCISDGKSNVQCMSDCSYNVAPVQKMHPAGIPDFTNRHNVFSTITPLDDKKIVLTAPENHAQKLSPNWTCMKDCLKPSTPYMSCEKQCTPDPTKSKLDKSGTGLQSPSPTDPKTAKPGR